MKKPGSAEDPLWYKDAVIYEVHVKAFFDANNDGNGDFAGLTQKLDYLQELGVTCLWLLPFYPSPLRDDGYDISDYCNVHPSYGNLEDFQRFLNAAHERDMQVLTELVINHSSDQHPWFQAARRAAAGSPERDYYVWSDDPQKYKESRIIFTDTEKSNWAWDQEAQSYYWHRFFSHQPDLNFDNPAVIREVIKAMGFWMDMGVDALRLDAIPYLVEREGTNCENLSETHAVIKHIRSELEQRYASRMLLAEANQWPADVRHYFGDADECHMAFHFPLMPRIFMALRLEDRHPITEIMAQTPDIPDLCQWGLFLRNHDELTLEMVTDEERDYMYLAYSADPRMRINVGIRRRLAPLMDNNPRRIELLNSLLFSFPGTPILYYGDEIGMGDNIYLGDRNGVRTPMQWSADRNAGFSRCNPARLFSPPIMDAVYGYEAVNVEAQQSDSSSLLHWMRNMIALRKLFKVFGRGSMRFLHPANRKVLAYLREYRGERILCVANLSRNAQPVELDLSELAGMVPVEMVGYTEFPPIGRGAYPLTLGPYGFYWFEMQGEPAPPEVETEQPAVEETPVLALDDGWAALLEGRGRQQVEAALPEFLNAHRWFGGKARRIESATVRDWADFLDDPPAALVLVEVEYAGGAKETYNVPLALGTGEATGPVLCRVDRRGETGVVFDATGLPEFGQALLEAMESGREIPSRRGAFRAFVTGAYGEVRGDRAEALAVKRGSAEQSNTSLLFGKRMIMKLFRRLEVGPNPDFEIGRYLTEERGFRLIPPLAGGIEYRAKGAEEATAAMLQGLVENQGDGWRWMLEELARYFERQAAAPPELDPTDSLSLSVDAAATLGCETAEMHLALGAPTENHAFAPEPLTRDELASLAADLRAHGSKVFDALKENLARLPDEIVDQAGLALSQRRKILDLYRNLESAGADISRIRIHGDYHLGQVLRVKQEFVLLDFEGEPARPLAERRAKYSAIKDVAGMLRSFSYAAYSSLLAYTTRRPDGHEQMEQWAELWERETSKAFLDAYLEKAKGANFLPKDEESLQRLLDAYLLDKALYELNYELNNRPDWVRIPLHGILALVGGES